MRIRIYLRSLWFIANDIFEVIFKDTFRTRILSSRHCANTPGETEKEANFIWGLSDSERLVSLACSFDSYKDLCTAAKTSPEALYSKFYHISSSAEQSQKQMYYDGSPHTYYYQGRQWLNDWSKSPTHDTFVSVLPGTYGISFYDENLKVYTDKYGIVVK